MTYWTSDEVTIMREMTDKEQYALRLIESTEVDTEEWDEMQREYFPHYGLYHREDDHQVVFCTHCEQWFNAHTSSTKLTSYGSKRFSTKRAVHGERDTCPLCERGITYLASGRGRKKYYDKRNFSVFRAVSDTEIVIRCFYLRRQFYEPSSGSLFGEICDHIFDYDAYEVCRYYFCLGEPPMRFLPKVEKQDGHYVGVWKKAAECKEPIFIMTPYSGADNSYTPIGDDVIGETKFRYLEEAINSFDVPSKHQSFLNANIITVLGEYCIHPQIEYLLKTGFSSLVVDKFDKSMCGIKLNWKSNNVKKVLGMTAEEMELLSGWDTVEIAHYKELRRRDSRSTAAEVAEMVKSSLGIGYSRYYFIRDELIMNRKETCRSILRYLKKNNTTIHEWSDYISQCRELKYDLEDPVIWKPSDLTAAHDRCSRVIEALREEEAAKRNRTKDRKLRLLNRARQVLLFTADDLGLTIVLPTCIRDIVNEGKALVHCVAGYADRHADGRLNILFVRKIGDEQTPYYTMEVNTDGRIVQCRGYKNDRESPKPESIKEFERQYQCYLDALYFFKIEPERAENKKKAEKAKKTA